MISVLRTCQVVGEQDVTHRADKLVCLKYGSQIDVRSKGNAEV